jgi:hypothetical protein
MKPELKELLKPPFERGGDYIYATARDGTNHPLVIIQDYFSRISCKSVTSLISDFIVRALTNEWEREYGEPLRWIPCIAPVIGYGFACEKCQIVQLRKSKFCPNCGKRLNPPEKGKEL